MKYFSLNRSAALKRMEAILNFQGGKEDFYVSQGDQDVAFVNKEDFVILSNKCYEWLQHRRLVGLKLKTEVKPLALQKLGLA